MTDYFGTEFDNTLSVTTANGQFNWYAGDGIDTLIVDYSATATGFTTSISGNARLIGPFNSIAYDIEHLNITGGSGNDQFKDMKTGDIVNGSAGTDRLWLYMDDVTASIDYNAVLAATDGGTGTLSGGTSIRNVEQLAELATGSGDDQLTLSFAQGNFNWYANDGIDRLVVDYSATATGFTTFIAGNNRVVGSTSNAYNIEHLTITGGSGNDQFKDMKTGDIVNGSDGTDKIWLNMDDVTASIDYNAVLAATDAGTGELGDGTSVRNVEQLAAFATGSGDDRLTVAFAQGAFSWYANDGDDRLVVDYSASATGFTTLQAGNNRVVSSTINAYDTEHLTITGSAGDDSFKDMKTGDIVDGSVGNDKIWLNMDGVTSDIAYDAVTAATGTGIGLTGGTSVKNVERLVELATGSGNDQLTVSFAQGVFTWYANDGDDRLIVDYSATATGFTTFQAGNNRVVGTSNAYNTEHLTITGGSGNDQFKDMLTGDVVDGGAGTDKLWLYMDSVTSDIDYNAVVAAGGTGITVGGGTSVKNVELLGELSTGFGNDQLTVSLAQGAFIWYANDGDDRLVGDYSATATGFSTSVAGNAYIIGLNNAYAYNIESVNIKGGSGDDVLNGTDGNDELNGNGGNDTLAGGAGIDTVSYADATGYITASLRLQGHAQDTHAAGQDTLTGIENLTGGTFNDTLTGDDNDNVLMGGAGIDILSGGDGTDTLDGGIGTDNLSGGFGDDIYYVDNINDFALEGAGAGTDLVYASLTYSLAGQQVENLTLTGEAAIDGTGNSLANIIIGNDAANILIGGSGIDTLNGMGGNDRLDGGLLADIMAGGAGDDTYIVDNFSDSVTENAGEGYDTVISAKTWTLGANFEALRLNSTDNFNLTGNALDNALTGGNGNNIIDGGLGADAMTGNKGDDIYYVDNAGDTVVEIAGEGTDKVISSVTFTLSGQQIENLTLTGSANVNATGNSLANILIGNAGNNVINGGGGADAMTGGAGNDTFTVDNAGDTVIEASGGGTDLVNASVTFSLSGQFVENLTLTGSNAINGTGNSLANTILGNNAANTLNGGTGADILSGKGGADVFLFGTSSGLDTISDFSATQGDSINVNAYTHGTAHAGYITHVGNDTLITLSSGNVITVLNTSAADVTAHMVW